MVKKKWAKRIKLDQTRPGPDSPTFSPQTSSMAPNTRADRFGPVDPNSGRELFAQTPFPSASGAVAASPAGNTIMGTPAEPSPFGAGPKTSLQAIGNSGTQIFGGYFSEEYLSDLRGRRAARMWDEMRRSEAQISMLMNAIMNPIKAANWDVESYDTNDEELKKHAELCKFALMEQIDFEQFKQEALTLIPFGFALMEKINSVTINHPKFGTFNGLKALAFRSQKTIENWQLESKTGKLLGVNQYTYSDLGGNQFIDGDLLLVFTHLKEGDNYEGISALRPMLGAYKRKDLYLKLAAIGVERYAIGTPIGTVPKGKEKSTEYDAFIKTLQNYTSHESSYITLPEGWKIDIAKGDFDASKIKELLIFENTEFANAVVGNFLALGMNGGGGAYALGSNLGEFFTSGIQAYADLICSSVNRDLLPSLVKMNFGPQQGYPKLKCTGISDKAGKELAETIKALSDARALDPDVPLKEFLRKQYKLPKPDPSTATALPAIPAGASANYPKPNDPVVDPATGKIKPFNTNQLLHDRARSIQLSDAKWVKRFDKNKADLKSLMQTNLTSMYVGLKDVLRKKYNAASGSAKLAVAKNVDMPGQNAYKAALKDALSEIAMESFQAARKLIPDGKKIQLAGNDYSALPPKVRKLIDAQSSLIVDTQVADIEKQTFFQFTSSATSSDDIDDILTDVDETVEDSIDGSTAEGMSVDAAAGDVIAVVEATSSQEFYKSPEAAEQIESFTFTNEDPISEICQSMEGTTVAPGDAIMDQYMTPLHHNCKSRWVPNIIGDDSNPDIGSGDAQTNGGLSLSKKALNSISLHEVKRYRLSEDKGRK